MVKKYAMLLMNNAEGNNNKFYELKLNDDDSVVIRYGRVGATGTTENKGYGEDIFDKVANSKRKKGYKDVDILTSQSTNAPTISNVSELAKRDIIKNNPVLENLIDKLAKINRHQLLGASGGNIDIVDGQVKTPLGLVTLESIGKAKNKLLNLNEFVTNNKLDNEYVNTLQDYLTLVPQKIPSKKGWHENFFTDFTNFQNQNALLEQIETSIKNYQPVNKIATDGVSQRLFGYSLHLLEDTTIFNKINKFYEANINRRHVSSSYKLKKIYVLTNDEKTSKYETYTKSLGNTKQLWHGTRACNVLSILKGGLIIPPTVGGNYTIAGRMFGNGVYFSDQSSKSLNYATPFWTGGSKELNELFMFLADVSMGKEYIPKGPMQTLPQGFDSIYAIGGKSGVMNNEMIVPHLDQFKLNYLCEFIE